MLSNGVFESIRTPNPLRGDLRAFDFSPETGKVKKLDLGPDQDHTFAGDATASFREAQPFRFLGLPM